MSWTAPNIGTIGCRIVLLFLILFHFSTALQSQGLKDLKAPEAPKVEAPKDLQGLKDLIGKRKGVVGEGKYKSFSKRSGVYVYEGHFQYSFMEERDGVQTEITDESPINDFTGANSKYIVVKVENFHINKNQTKDQYKIEFFCEGKLNGLEFEGATPQKFLEKEGEAIYLYFKPVSNNQTGYLDLGFRLYKLKKNKYETILSEKGIRQNYSIQWSEIKEEIPVKAGDPPQASFILEKGVVEIGEWIKVTNTSQNGKTWLWEFDGGDPATSDSQEPFVAFSIPGKRRIKLTATNDNGSIVVDQYVTVVEKEVEETIVPVVDTSAAPAAPKTGKALFEEVVGMTWDNAVVQNLVKESDYFDFQTAGEIQEVLDRNKEIIPRVKQTAKGSFTVELENAVTPMEIEIVNNKEGVKIKSEDGNKIKFKVSDNRDHEVRIQDRRNKSVSFILPGSLEALMAKFANKEKQLEFKISGGRKPYFVELTNVKTGKSEEFSLGDCNECTLSKDLIKKKLKKNHGQYNIIVKDQSKSFQKKLKDTFEYKGKSTMKLLPLILLGVLALIFVVLTVIVVLQNKK